MISDYVLTVVHTIVTTIDILHINYWHLYREFFKHANFVHDRIKML